MSADAPSRAVARLGVILLAHTALHRAAQVARFWAEEGVPVALHVDARVPAADHARLVQALADRPEVLLAPRRRCEWGTWSIVAAMQDAATLLLAQTDVTHVLATSGACLPLRPAGDLARFLDRYPDTDFIESVSLEDVNWTKGGLSHERFTLFHPVGFRRSKWLFDRLVDAQRALRVRRALPAGLDPHLGSQWWCLTRPTLGAILADPERRSRERFFRSTWIPDESWFQTLVRLHARRIESRSLTLGKFDHQGKPHLFYDDHLQLLKRSDCFVARKIWPGAERLYAQFLAPRPPSDAAPQPARIDRHFARATEQRLRGRAGLTMVGRFPTGGRGGPPTAAPYAVFQGFAELYRDFDLWLSGLGGCRVHGRLFAPERAEFAGGERVFAGGLSDSAPLRDYHPTAFLANLIWATRGERQAFQIGPGDRLGKDLAVLRFIAGDRNARVSVISGAWAVPMARRRGDPEAIRREAARLQRIEMAMLEVLQAPEVRAEVRIWTLAEFLENPVAAFQPVLAGILPQGIVAPRALPEQVDLSRFGGFLQELRNRGMAPVVMGEFPLAPAAPDPTHRMK